MQERNSRRLGEPLKDVVPSARFYSTINRFFPVSGNPAVLVKGHCETIIQPFKELPVLFSNRPLRGEHSLPAPSALSPPNEFSSDAPRRLSAIANQERALSKPTHSDLPLPCD
jgi:hypothetical protein